MERGLKILSYMVILAGALLILNAFSGLTGFVVSEAIGINVSSILGVILFIGGIILLQYAHQYPQSFESVLANLIERYDEGQIGDVDSLAKKINSLRGGQQIQGMKYVRGGVDLDTRSGGEVTFAVEDKNKLEDLATSLYFTGMANKGAKLKNFDIRKLDKRKVAKKQRELKKSGKL
jgi:hypothetical protein